MKPQDNSVKILMAGLLSFPLLLPVPFLCAQDADLIAVGKEKSYSQDSPDQAVLADSEPYEGFAFIEENLSGSILSIPAPTLTPPNLSPVSFEERPEDDEWEISGEFNSLTGPGGLDEAFPNGAYTINYTGANDGAVSGTLSVTGDTYPNPPTLTAESFNTLQSLNLSAGFTLRWGDFIGAATDDFIIIDIEDRQQGGSIIETDPFEIDGTVTSFPVPAGLLDDNGGYEVCIDFINIVEKKTIGGADAAAFYGSNTCIDVGDTSFREFSLIINQNNGTFNQPENSIVTSAIFPLSNVIYNITYGFEDAAANFPSANSVTFGAPAGSGLNGTTAENSFVPDQGIGFGTYNSPTVPLPTNGTSNDLYSVSFSGVEQFSREFDLPKAIDQHLIPVPTIILKEDNTIETLSLAYRDVNNEEASSTSFIENVYFNINDRNFNRLEEGFNLSGQTATIIPAPGIAWDDVGSLSIGYSTREHINYFTFYENSAAGPMDPFEGVDLGEGFLFSAWYGIYNPLFFPWVFHVNHGWQYVFTTENPGEVFLFDLESQDFWWTSSAFADSFFTFFSFNRGTFNFYFDGTANPRSFVDLETEEFYTIPSP